MSVIIHLLGLANGVPSEFDDTYLVEYDPSYWPAGERYDGGILKVTRDAALAKLFPTAKEAMECWQQSFGTRPDGKPNRPLTAWSVEIAAPPLIVVQ